MDLSQYEEAVNRAEELARILLQDPIGIIDENYYYELARLLIQQLEESEIEEVLGWYNSPLGEKVQKIGTDFIKDILSKNS